MSGPIERAGGVHDEIRRRDIDIFCLMPREELEACGKEGTKVENEMGRCVAVKAFAPAILFSFIYSLACIMEGFDTILISNFFALPQFKEDFGCTQPGSVRSEEGDCEIPGGYQAGLLISALVGQIIGIILSGWFTEKYGYRKTFLGALGAMSAAIFVVFFSPNLAVLVFGEFLCGIPWGVFQTLSASYSSDVCITPIRAYATSWNNLCWVIGQLVASGVQQPLVTNRTSLSYKLPLTLQWIWPVAIVILLVISRAPESPWWLVRRGRTLDAIKAVKRLSKPKHLPEGYSAYNHVAMMTVTNEHEENDKDNGTGSTGYGDCFRGVNLRRTLICCTVWAAQNACGSSLMQASTYFLTQNGVNELSAFNFTIGQYGLGIGGAILSWVLVAKCGRRTLLFNGQCISLAILLVIGILSVLGHSGQLGLVIGALLLVFTFTYNATIGPITYSIVAELPSTRLKAKTINLARTAYIISALVNNAITTPLLNPTGANLGAKIAWIFVGITGFCALFTFFFVPEPKNLTYGQIDDLFARKVSARAFKSEGIRLRAEEANRANAVELKDGIATPSSAKMSDVVVEA